MKARSPCPALTIGVAGLDEVAAAVGFVVKCGVDGVDHSSPADSTDHLHVIQIAEGSVSNGAEATQKKTHRG